MVNLECMKSIDKIVVFTGAGISAESGIKTFRDSGGLWEEYDVNDVATPEGWKKNLKMVLEFYNKRRKQVLDAKPNAAHIALAELELRYNVHIVTQNIDNLHERAGSTNVLHLHGEVTKSQSSIDPTLIYTITGSELNEGDACEKGSQLRPHIVWFGESVPNMAKAYDIVSQADLLIVVGTSLNVYPAASVIDYAPTRIKKYLIDPNLEDMGGIDNLTVINALAGIGVPKLVKELLKQ